MEADPSHLYQVKPPNQSPGYGLPPFAGAAPLNANVDHICLQSKEKSRKFHWAGQSNISKSSCCW